MDDLKLHSLPDFSEYLYDQWTLTPRSDKDDSFTEMWGFAENEYKKGNKQFLELFLLMAIKTNNLPNKPQLIKKYTQLL